MRNKDLGKWEMSPNILKDQIDWQNPQAAIEKIWQTPLEKEVLSLAN